MSHANATLTPITRLRLARLIVDDGWTYASAAKKWADRYRTDGTAGMGNRSSRPKSSPTKTPREVVRQIVALRWRHRLGPVQIAGRLSMPASTVHAVLVRCRINRLSHIDRVTGEPLRRYEHEHPGSLFHVDVTKFGNIPDGGGWRYVGRVQGRYNAQATARRTGRRGRHYRPLIGTAFVQTYTSRSPSRTHRRSWQWGGSTGRQRHSAISAPSLCTTATSKHAEPVELRGCLWASR
ncbi:integrase catalytic subunit [Rhodococcus triatomae BKS 15-14]|nr:integrase catalytic subunit [Rhodococcus triatomae BKS 15-14]